MRRTVAVVCVALGVFAMVLAPLLRYWVADSVMRTPMDYYQEPVHRSEDATYFSVEELDLIEGAIVEAHTTLRADVAASDEEVVVWDQFTWIEDIERDFAIQSSTRRVGHHRETGEAVDCCDASINEESVPQEGQAYKWPFLTEQRDYEFFDTTSQQTLPMVFDGVDTVNGIETYRFVQEVPETRVGEREMPASLLGLDEEGDVTADEMYSVTRTYWIEPNTGTPLDQREQQRRVAVAEGEELVLFEADLRWTEETVETYIDSASTGMTIIPLLRTILPITLLAVGGLLLVLSVPLYLSGRDSASGQHRL